MYYGFVEENNLPVHISALRRVLKERESGIKYIETVSGIGYCFLTPVEEVNSNILSALSKHLSPKANKIRSIAVLPFINKNPDSKFEYLAEGITDSLISNLSQISQLKVISYSAVSQYKDKQSNLQEAGFLLGVDSILTGSLIEIDGLLEIRVELVKVSDLSHIWGTNYQCKVEHLFKTKTEISVAIADKLQIQLTKSDAKQLIKQPTENSEAYQIYLKGRRFAETHSKQGLLKAVDCFNETLKLDPKFALAHADIAYAYIILGLSFFIPINEAVPKALASIQMALMTDESLSEAHAVNGFFQLYKLDLIGSKESFKNAIKLNSNSGFSHAHYGIYFLAVGDFKKALSLHYRSIELNPHTISFAALSSKLMMMGEFQQAIDNTEDTLELFSNRSNIYYGLAFSYAHLRKFDSALRNIQIAIELTLSTENMALASYIYALSENHSEAIKILNKLIDNYDTTPVDLYDIAAIYNALEDKDRTFEYLEKAFKSKFSHIFLLKIDPRFKSLHSDPRFEPLLRRIGLT